MEFITSNKAPKLLFSTDIITIDQDKINIQFLEDALLKNFLIATPQLRVPKSTELVAELVITFNWRLESRSQRSTQPMEIAGWRCNYDSCSSWRDGTIRRQRPMTLAFSGKNSLVHTANTACHKLKFSSEFNPTTRTFKIGKQFIGPLILWQRITAESIRVRNLQKETKIKKTLWCIRPGSKFSEWEDLSTEVPTSKWGSFWE